MNTPEGIDRIVEALLASRQKHPDLLEGVLDRLVPNVLGPWVNTQGTVVTQWDRKPLRPDLWPDFEVRVAAIDDNSQNTTAWWVRYHQKFFNNPKGVEVYEDGQEVLVETSKLRADTFLREQGFILLPWEAP
jgi:hypothetical protein